MTDIIQHRINRPPSQIVTQDIHLLFQDRIPGLTRIVVQREDLDPDDTAGDYLLSGRMWHDPANGVLCIGIVPDPVP